MCGVVRASGPPGSFPRRTEERGARGYLRNAPKLPYCRCNEPEREPLPGAPRKVTGRKGPWIIGRRRQARLHARQVVQV